MVHMQLYMRVLINGNNQVNIHTTYDICKFLVTKNLKSDPFEPPHICLCGSKRHKKIQSTGV
jgi:hypothetical protein